MNNERISSKRCRVERTIDFVKALLILVCLDNFIKAPIAPCILH